MNCHEIRELFSARADERLTPDQRSALNGHLEGCLDCSREWERFSRTVGLLRGIREAQAPAGLARRVIDAARREERWHRRLLRGMFLPLRVKLPLEAAALVLISTLVIVLYRQTPEFQRPVEPSPAPGMTAPVAEPPAKSAEPEQARPYGEAAPPQASTSATEERKGAPEDVKEKDRFAKKQEAAPAEPPTVGGRLDVSREAQKSAAVRTDPRPAARPQGPFHLMGRLRPKSPDTIDNQLNDLIKQVGGILVRDAERVGVGSIVEVIVPRDAYPRLETGLRQLGEFTVETRVQTLPDQVRIGIRIAD